MDKLNNYKFSTKDGFNSTLLKLRYVHLSKFFKGDRCLELGSADGEGTKILLEYFKSVAAVDGSSKLLNLAKKNVNNKNVLYIESFFEDLDLKEKFDTIVMGHILEHVDDPIKVVKVAAKHLKPKGVVIIDVPNAMSIHRQVGVLMGMLRSEYELNAADKSIGHKRVYDMDKLIKDVESGGLKVKKNGGLFLKPFSNAQMEKILDKKGINSFNEMGIKYPDISAEIFVVCTL